MEEKIEIPSITTKKHFLVWINYDDPYPKQFKSDPIQARSADRAVVFAFRAFKKTRKPRFNFRVRQI